MFLQNFFGRRQVRQFHFTPFYYKEEVEEESEGTGPRIKFRKIRRGSPVAKKSIKGLVVLAVLLLFGFFYLWGLVNEETRSFQIEDIKIEETPNF